MLYWRKRLHPIQPLYFILTHQQPIIYTHSATIIAHTTFLFLFIPSSSPHRTSSIHSPISLSLIVSRQHHLLLFCQQEHEECVLQFTNLWICCRLRLRRSYRLNLRTPDTAQYSCEPFLYDKNILFLFKEMGWLAITGSRSSPQKWVIMLMMIVCGVILINRRSYVLPVYNH